VNCQVGVFLAYASAAGGAFIDRALYLPQEWTDDRERRTEAGILKETRFATKIDLARHMLARALACAARLAGSMGSRLCLHDSEVDRDPVAGPTGTG